MSTRLGYTNTRSPSSVITGRAMDERRENHKLRGPPVLSQEFLLCPGTKGHPPAPGQFHDFWKLLVPKNRPSLARIPPRSCSSTHRSISAPPASSSWWPAPPQGQDLYFSSFCSGGSIEQIQVKQYISVILCTFAPSFQQEDSTRGLTMSFVPYLKEGVFRVTPDMKARST